MSNLILLTVKLTMDVSNKSFFFSSPREQNFFHKITQNKPRGNKKAGKEKKEILQRHIKEGKKNLTTTT